MHYPVRITKQNSGASYTVRFADVPEALTIGDTPEDALRHAADALESALDFYFEDGRAVPMPSPAKRGQKLVALPISAAAKVLLHNEMVHQHVRPAELARRMKVPPQHITRLLNPKHTTKIDTVAEALHALGKELTVSAA